jgi:hypothetical protein
VYLCIVLCYSLLYLYLLYCIILYCTLLYCILLYFTVLYCIVLYCIVLYCTYYTILYCIILYCTYTIFYLYCIVLYYTVFLWYYDTLNDPRAANQSSHIRCTQHYMLTQCAISVLVLHYLRPGAPPSIATPCHCHPLPLPPLALQALSHRHPFALSHAQPILFAREYDFVPDSDLAEERQTVRCQCQ